MIEWDGKQGLGLLSQWLWAILVDTKMGGLDPFDSMLDPSLNRLLVDDDFFDVFSTITAYPVSLLADVKTLPTQTPKIADAIRRPIDALYRVMVATHPIVWKERLEDVWINLLPFHDVVFVQLRTCLRRTLSQGRLAGEEADSAVTWFLCLIERYTDVCIMLPSSFHHLTDSTTRDIARSVDGFYLFRCSVMSYESGVNIDIPRSLLPPILFMH